MEYKPIKLTNGMIYALNIPDMPTDKPMTGKDEIILDLSNQINQLEKDKQELIDCMVESWRSVESVCSLEADHISHNSYNCLYNLQCELEENIVNHTGKSIGELLK